MARQTITPQHSTKSNYDNVTIDSGLRADIMRCQMESKNTLTQNGSIYVGVGRADSNGIAYTKELRSGNQYQCLKVINADGDIGYGYLDWNNFNQSLTINGGQLNVNNGKINISGTNGNMPELNITNLGTLKIDNTAMCIFSNPHMNFVINNSNPYPADNISFVHQTNNAVDGNTYGLGFKTDSNWNIPAFVLQRDYGSNRKEDIITMLGTSDTYILVDCENLQLSGSLNCQSSVLIQDTVQIVNDDDNNKLYVDDLWVRRTHTWSDKRLKTNIVPFSSQKSILDLPVYKFDFLKGPKNSIGCLAQDLQQICPELVDEDEKGYLAIQENKIVFLLLEEVKKLRKEVDELKKEH